MRTACGSFCLWFENDDKFAIYKYAQYFETLVIHPLGDSTLIGIQNFPVKQLKWQNFDYTTSRIIEMSPINQANLIRTMNN